MRAPWMSTKRKRWAEKDGARSRALKALAAANKDNKELQSSVDALDEFARELVDEICRAATQWHAWHNIGRIGAAASSLTAAGAGGALTAGLSDSAVVIVGYVVLILGILGGLATALGADSEYVWERQKARGFEALWWEIRIYSINEFESKPGARVERLNEFVQTRKRIAVSGSA